jgi:hypothetical protein
MTYEHPTGAPPYPNGSSSQYDEWHSSGPNPAMSPEREAAIWHWASQHADHLATLFDQLRHTAETIHSEHSGEMAVAISGRIQVVLAEPKIHEINHHLALIRQAASEFKDALEQAVDFHSNLWFVDLDTQLARTIHASWEDMYIIWEHDGQQAEQVLDWVNEFILTYENNIKQIFINAGH